MKRSTYIVVAISLALFGCGEMQTKGGGIAVNPAGPPKEIKVFVQNGIINVPEDPAYVTKGHAAIIWILPAGIYTFPTNGIVIDHVDFGKCYPLQQGKQFMCPRNIHIPLKKYKYGVNVDDSSNPQNLVPLQPLDPWIFNE